MQSYVSKQVSTESKAEAATFQDPRRVAIKKLLSFATSKPQAAYFAKGLTLSIKNKYSEALLEFVKGFRIEIENKKTEFADLTQDIMLCVSECVRFLYISQSSNAPFKIEKLNTLFERKAYAEVQRFSAKLIEVNPTCGFHYSNFALACYYNIGDATDKAVLDMQAIAQWLCLEPTEGLKRDNKAILLWNECLRLLSYNDVKQSKEKLHQFYDVIKKYKLTATKQDKYEDTWYLKLTGKQYNEYMYEFPVIMSMLEESSLQELVYIEKAAQYIFDCEARFYGSYNFQRKLTTREFPVQELHSFNVDYKTEQKAIELKDDPFAVARELIDDDNFLFGYNEIITVMEKENKENYRGFRKTDRATIQALLSAECIIYNSKVGNLEADYKAIIGCFHARKFRESLTHINNLIQGLPYCSFLYMLRAIANFNISQNELEVKQNITLSEWLSHNKCEWTELSCLFKLSLHFLALGNNITSEKYFQKFIKVLEKIQENIVAAIRSKNKLLIPVVDKRTTQLIKGFKLSFIDFFSIFNPNLLNIIVTKNCLPMLIEVAKDVYKDQIAFYKVFNLTALAMTKAIQSEKDKKPKQEAKKITKPFQHHPKKEGKSQPTPLQAVEVNVAELLMPEVEFTSLVDKLSVGSSIETSDEVKLTSASNSKKKRQRRKKSPKMLSEEFKTEVKIESHPEPKVSTNFDSKEPEKITPEHYITQEKVEISDKIVDIIKKLKSHSHLTFGVGGKVRCQLEKEAKDSADVDLVTAASGEAVLKILSENYNVIQPRKDNNKLFHIYPKGADKSTNIPPIAEIWCSEYLANDKVHDNLRLDAIHRDFTVNAFYVDENKRVYSVFKNAFDDLKNRRLCFIKTKENQSVQDSINEDPTRLLRAIEFWVNKGYKPGQEEYAAICAKSSWDRLLDVSSFESKSESKIDNYGLINSKLAKIFARGNPRKAIENMRSVEAFAHFFPEVNAKLKTIKKNHTFYQLIDACSHSFINIYVCFILLVAVDAKVMELSKEKRWDAIKDKVYELIKSNPFFKTQFDWIESQKMDVDRNFKSMLLHWEKTSPLSATSLFKMQIPDKQSCHASMPLAGIHS